MNDSTDRVHTIDRPLDDGSIDLSGGWRRASTPARAVRAKAGLRARAVERSVFEETRAARDALIEGRADRELLTTLAHPRAAVQPSLLTEAIPVDVMRSGLAAAYREARRGADAEGARLALEAAATAEARRGALIERLLGDCFANYPELERSIVAVVEGGATRGDPEYQGIFGDIDCTVFTVDDQRALWRVSEALCNSFAWTGYPLTQNGQNTTLDLHLFVQCARPAQPGAGQGDDGGAIRLPAGLPLRREIGARNPERFVSEVGVRWIVNQMYFSGRPLRGRLEHACVPTRIAPSEARAFATDVTCHMGSALLDALAPDFASYTPQVQRHRLTLALNEAKHVLRLVDAWLISHPDGNRLYHERFAQPRHRTRGTSYHSAVVDDALRLLDAGKAGRVLLASDGILLRNLAALKLRTRYPSPWDLLGHGPEARERASDIVHGMYELVRRLLRAVCRP